MIRFARIFERPAGQILAVLTNMQEDGRPAVILSWLPSPAHELCHLPLLFELSNEGATKAQIFHQTMTLEQACEIIGKASHIDEADGERVPMPTHDAPKGIQ